MSYCDILIPAYIIPPTTPNTAIIMRIIAQMGSSETLAGSGAGAISGPGTGAMAGPGTGAMAGPGIYTDGGRGVFGTKSFGHTIQAMF